MLLTGSKFFAVVVGIVRAPYLAHGVRRLPLISPPPPGRVPNFFISPERVPKFGKRAGQLSGSGRAHWGKWPVTVALRCPDIALLDDPA